MSWHSTTCPRLDLEWIGGLPRCRKCLSSSAHLMVEHPEAPEPAPPFLQSRFHLTMRWPPCISYAPVVPSSEPFQEADQWPHEATVRGMSNEPESHPANRYHLQDPESTTAFVYRSLSTHNTIRLLRLYGSDCSDDPIHCLLCSYELGSPTRPVYEALSYTWADEAGDKRRRCHIFIGPEYDLLLATNNCLSALRQIRTRFDRFLWVDAICINQDDIVERDQQVSLMRSIYSSAARVLIYLGRGNHDTDKAMCLLNRAQSDNFQSNDQHSEEVPGDSVRVNCNQAITNEDKLSTCRHLLEIPYFRRIWVIQEAALAREATITCGDVTQHWSAFCEGLRSPEIRLEDSLAGAWVVTLPSLKREGTPTLFELYQSTLHCCSGDPRDRLFALMGLISEEEAERLPVDYSLTVQELFTGITAYWIQKDVPELGRHLGTKNRMASLPSWVPDWADQSVGTKPYFTLYSPTTSPVLDRSRGITFWPGDPNIVPSHKINHWFPRESEYSRRNPFWVTMSGCLYTAGYGLFSYQSGKVFYFFKEDEYCSTRKSIDFLIADEWREALNQDYHFEVFWIPKLQDVLLLKRQSEHSSAFSIQGRCHIDTGRGQAGESGETLSSTLERWMHNLMFLGIRCAVSIKSLLSTDEAPLASNSSHPGIWFWKKAALESLTNWRSSNVEEVFDFITRDLVSRDSPPCDPRLFKAMKLLRKRIIDMLPQTELDVLLEMERSLPKFEYTVSSYELSREEISDANCSDSEFRDAKPSESSWFDAWYRWRGVRDIARDWTNHLTDAETDVREWETGVPKLRDRLAELGLFSDVLKSCHYGGSRHFGSWGCAESPKVQPLISFCKAVVANSASPSTCTRDSEDDGVGVRPFPWCEHDTDLGKITFWTWEIVKRTYLDPELPLEWNRHQFWVCYLGLVFVVQLRETIEFEIFMHHLRRSLLWDKTQYLTLL